MYLGGADIRRDVCGTSPYIVNLQRHICQSTPHREGEGHGPRGADSFSAGLTLNSRRSSIGGAMMTSVTPKSTRAKAA